jgi:hypothetical protein
MPNSPQIEAANQLIIDVADNPDLREIFSSKEAGDKCKLTMHLQVMSKTQETVTLAVEKIVTDPSDYHTDEAEPTLKEPIMATMHRNRHRNRGGEKEMPMGKHNRPEQTAENSAEPWLKSYT